MSISLYLVVFIIHFFFFFFFFFFNDTATTEIYTLSLHDALPIPLGIAEHALRSSAVSEPKILEMPAAKAELDRAEPKIPVFEAELHALVEPGTSLEYGAPDQAAGLADV